jgi:TatD DNase family protein
MIDTHAHLYDSYFLTDLNQHIAEIQDNGITEVWLPNCDLESWNSLSELRNRFPAFTLPMIGLHPTYVKEDFKHQLKELKAILDSQKMLAVGEIGLDYYWDIQYKSEQIIAFEEQCNWALDKNIWIDIHCRKAYADLIKILKKPDYKNVIGIVHCFSGDAREAEVLVDLGFILGIGGVITYKNTTLFDSIKHISLEHIVLETDSPYLTPVPFRGSPNSPKNLPLIAQKLADLYEVSLEKVVYQTNQNAQKLKKYANY